MPSLLPLPGCVKLTFTHDNSLLGGAVNRAANILHLEYNDGFEPTPTDLVTIANAATTWWGTHFKPLISNSWQLNGVVALHLDGAGNLGASTTAAVPGTAVGTILPPQCAVAVSWLGYPGV